VGSFREVRASALCRGMLFALAVPLLFGSGQVCVSACAVISAFFQDAPLFRTLPAFGGRRQGAGLAAHLWMDLKHCGNALACSAFFLRCHAFAAGGATELYDAGANIPALPGVELSAPYTSALAATGVAYA